MTNEINAARVLTSDQLTRYSRNILIQEIGPIGQKKLLASRVLVIGLGGLGSPAALYLAAAGVGTIGLADGDQVELSNLQRQILHVTPNIGRPKVDSARRAVLALNPEIKVRVFGERVTAANILGLIQDYDFVLDGTDSFAAKFLINDACVSQGKPFCHAGVIRFQGQLTTYSPGRPCYRCLFEELPAPGGAPTCGQEGIVGAVAGVTGGLQALEAIKYLTNAGTVLSGSLLTINGLTMEFRKVKFPQNPACSACGAGSTGFNPSLYSNSSAASQGCR
ncbi:MAG: HesA/MoeB/ThiF family protein [Deltaproteobacteria bacterium]|nr:HesA/MoeB/ThiF family protein [Deltaproteobacteria bacterium]